MTTITPVHSRPVRTAAATRSGPTRRRRRRNVSARTRWAYRILGGVLACALWEVTGRRGTFGSAWVPMSDVVREGWRSRDLLTRSLKATMPTIIKGFIFGVLIGSVLAFLPTVVPPLSGVSRRLATFVNALPVVVLAPVLITILGIGKVQVLVAAISCFFPMFIAAAAGLNAARRSHLDVMSVLGAKRWTQFRRVRLPAALPAITDGFRLAAPAAVLGAIFGEWFGAEKGIGAVLVSSMQNFRINLLWAAAMLATLLSIIALAGFTALSTWAHRRFA
jgi:ABC-type nitrate/sulfonate/bicarbonate transport system permease component